MLNQAWQVGLDIQSHCIRALAAQRRRNGWQLRHWWQQTLPQPVLREGCLEQTDALIQALWQWRIQLPRHISLRIALPAQRVLQHRMPLPDARLKEPARGDYITSQGLKQFPLDSQTLALDYRPLLPEHATLLLTAARQQELQQWLHCLLQANLQPQVVDITPCALRSMAAAAGVSAEAGLLHRLDQEWLWAAPHRAAFAYGLVPIREAGGATQALAAMHAACPSLSEHQIYYSSVKDELPPTGCLPWSPFSAFSQLRPPLPQIPAAFVLAGGLALRTEDS
ncbi:pilus assembly protein PilM [Pseudomonas lundensis]|uniref:type IV pilus biogenesis protein PilM n=1 Tax=Serratia proteamaculans TaxID=28151 RepID=UPI0029828A6E|nr:pilus assembly protein PilM [Serratia proteamaculans]MDW5501759.1 pilus assembly protein PilM [Serratia proteamaculans]MDW5506822.1 pilus assembly protein PilM [Pseudomonas lundensis]